MITLGKSPTITVQITVKNVKEPAYLSELLIDLPSELPSIKYDYFCDLGNQQNNASLVCNLGNPLRNGTRVRRIQDFYKKYLPYISVYRWRFFVHFLALK